MIGLLLMTSGLAGSAAARGGNELVPLGMAAGFIRSRIALQYRDYAVARVLDCCDDYSRFEVSFYADFFPCEIDADLRRWIDVLDGAGDAADAVDARHSFYDQYHFSHSWMTDGEPARRSFGLPLWEGQHAVRARRAR